MLHSERLRPGRAALSGSGPARGGGSGGRHDGERARTGLAGALPNWRLGSWCKT